MVDAPKSSAGQAPVSITGAAQAEMPRYASHKKVWALKIAKIEIVHNQTIITPAENGYAPFVVTDDYVRKHQPAPGGYFVTYVDGYQSWSPGRAFEEGNSLDADVGGTPPSGAPSIPDAGLQATLEAKMAELGEDKRPAALAESIEASFAAREKDAAIISAARELVDLIRAAPSDHPAVQKLIKAVDDHPQTKEGTSDGKEANKAEGP